MKVLYDYQTFYNQNFGGISRYFFELFESYNNDSAITYELPIKYSDNIYLKESPSFKNSISPKVQHVNEFELFLKGFNFKGKGKLFTLKQKYFPTQSINDLEENKKISIEKIKEGNFDIFHPTYYDDYFLDFIGSKPYVITVYDMIYQIFPEYFLQGGIDKSKTLLQNANKVLAISECTKKDLVSIYGIDESKIEVTYLANSLTATNLGENDFFKNQLPSNYLLFVGNRDAYKNFYFFVQAFCVLLKDFKDLCIICTGKPLERHELAYLENLGISNKVHHHYIDDDKLSILYKNAKVFVFPSMYEGFGIPVLEAFACDCPVVNSNGGSLPEVGGNAALYFEPKNIGGLISSLKKILLNEDFRNEMIRNGREQLKKFSWQKTAADTKEIYKQVLNN